MIYKFVITGGPCAGKTTALKKIKEVLLNSGLNVLIIPETATELINGNVTPANMGVFNMQSLIFRLQLEKEAVFSLAAQRLDGDTVIILDRGLLDGNAYINDDGFNKIVESYGYTREQIMSRYDAVFHLASAANGAEKFYSLANNSARSEDTDTARLIDIKTADVWKMHPNYTLINSNPCFDNKIENLITEIISFID